MKKLLFRAHAGVDTKDGRINRIFWRSNMFTRSSMRVFALALALFLTGAAPLARALAAQEFQPQVGQDGKDVIWVPTPQELVDKMLEMAKVTPKDYVIDLGSGDGRTVITAAKKGSKALGIEYNPDWSRFQRKPPPKKALATKRAL